jgi:hypothetical protein
MGSGPLASTVLYPGPWDTDADLQVKLSSVFPTRYALRLLLALVVLIVAGCSSGSGKRSTTTTTVRRVLHPTSTVRLAPLTGLPTSGPGRAALSVEINHTPGNAIFGGFLTGVDHADVVYEYVVEGGITRLVAVFNSQLPDRIGPIRSVRRTEASIVWPLGGVFAFSGGAQYALNSIDTAPVVRVQESNAGAAMFRDPKGYPPNNLYGNGTLLVAKARRTSEPQPLFAYHPRDTPVVGRSVSSFVVGFQAGYAITWTWDPQTATWTRQAFSAPEKTATGVQLGAMNVVVMFVQYTPRVDVQGAQAQLLGHGKAMVFSDGKLSTGQWSRTNNTQPAEFRDANGQTIRLTPGQTWVELIPTTFPVTLSPSPPDQ